MKRAARWPWLAIDDARRAIAGNSDPLRPPRRLQLPSWRGPYRRLGERWLQWMVEVGELRPQHRVLDIGCGSGRLAVPLTDYLDGGSYEGFDIVPGAVEWCRTAISSRYPSFRFELADVRNAQYNPKGGSLASEYRFPYGDESFDLAVAASVFTHMRPTEIGRYLEEAARTLKAGGRLLATFFLVNEESERLSAEGNSRLRFDQERDEASGLHCWKERRIGEYGIALRESDVRVLCEQAGLRVETIRYGSWAGREPTGHLQDLLALVKGSREAGDLNESHWARDAASRSRTWDPTDRDV